MTQELKEKSNTTGMSRSVESLLRVGARIRGLRRSHGLTQEELAHRSNLTKGFISQLERDLTSPSLESLLEILEALDTDIVRFFQGRQEGTHRVWCCGFAPRGDLSRSAGLSSDGARGGEPQYGARPRDDGTGRVDL